MPCHTCSIKVSYTPYCWLPVCCMVVLHGPSAADGRLAPKSDTQAQAAGCSSHTETPDIQISSSMLNYGVKSRRIAVPMASHAEAK